jgi:ABC-type multidrug transport system ATPase subunit
VSEPVLVLEQVSKHFGSRRALDGVSLSVPGGTVWGLIGPNGAGKSTTFNLLCGYLRPSAGRVRVAGRDPRAPGSLKGVVGVLPQDAALPGALTTGPLLTYLARLSGLERPEREARVALERVGLSEVWEVPPSSLSHGMARRVGIAQALLGDPPVVLLDEPTSGLDPRVAAEVRSLLQRMRGPSTVLVSSHNLPELEAICDGAAILDRGHLLQAGTMAELTARSAEFRIQVARGDVPLQAIRALPGVEQASLGTGGLLSVVVSPGAGASDATLSATLRLLLDAGVQVTGVSQGQSLESRVLSLT